MIFRFDPDRNPYADDLLRLALTPAGRFSSSERLVIARVLAGKLYEVSHFRDAPFMFVGSRRYRENGSGRGVVIDVFFDDDFSNGIPSRRYLYSNKAAALIILCVGKYGVVELYNAAVKDLTYERIWEFYDQADDPEFEPIVESDGRVPVRADDAAASSYLGEDAEEGGRPWADLRGGRDRGGGDNTGGGGASGGGDGTGGGGEGGVGDGAGAGGTGELLDHPVLLSIDRDIFNSLLDQT
ncbi:hypothetical protein [Paraburkholderia sp.]|uniref:hypothetical protein n=1 Tax=Paraburkholderia sp. TaxID=1926495 RepID=UPI003D6DB858